MVSVANNDNIPLLSKPKTAYGIFSHKRKAFSLPLRFEPTFRKPYGGIQKSYGKSAAYKDLAQLWETQSLPGQWVTLKNQ